LTDKYHQIRKLRYAQSVEMQIQSMPTQKAKLLRMTSHYEPTVVRSVTEIPFHVIISWAAEGEQSCRAWSIVPGPGQSAEPQVGSGWEHVSRAGAAVLVLCHSNCVIRHPAHRSTPAPAIFDSFCSVFQYRQ